MHKTVFLHLLFSLQGAAESPRLFGICRRRVGGGLRCEPLMICTMVPGSSHCWAYISQRGTNNGWLRHNTPEEKAETKRKEKSLRPPRSLFFTGVIN